MKTFVIAGASLAGATAAQTLREEGFDGRVVLIGDEPERPYERPPLSVDHLRTVADADELRARLGRGGRAVVVRAGWIGAEVAASARQHGLEVTLIDPLSVPLERVLGREVGAVDRGWSG